MTEKIKIEQIVFGSLANKIADNTISYSSNASSEAQEFNTMFDSEANMCLAKDFASFVAWLSPKSLRYTFLHVQGNHIVFESDGRYFATRCVYEVSREDMQRINYDYYSLLEKLPRMQRRYETGYGVNSDTQVSTYSHDENSLNKNEQQLFSLVSAAILKGRQVYIQLSPTTENYAENGVLESKRLKSIFKVMSTLEPVLAEYASVAFSVDSSFHRIAANIPDTLIIAHQDGLENWPHYPDDIIADWRGDDIISKSIVMNDCEKIVKSIALLPVLKEYFNQEADAPYKEIYRYVQSVKVFLDEAIDNPNPSDNAIQLLDLSYSRCSDKNAYRHKDMALKLLELLGKGKCLTTSTKQIMDEYGKEFNNLPIIKEMFKAQAKQATTLGAMENIISDISDVKNADEITEIIKDKILNDWYLIDDFIANYHKLPKLEKICHEAICDTVKKGLSIRELCNKKEKYDNYISYIDLSQGDLKGKVDSWESLRLGCYLIGSSYATVLSEEYKKWKVETVEQLNSAWNIINDLQKSKRQPELVKRLLFHVKEVFEKKQTLGVYCEMLMNLNKDIAFDSAILKPSALGNNAKEKLDMLRERSSMHYNNMKIIYDELSKRNKIKTIDELFNRLKKSPTDETSLLSLTKDEIVDLATQSGNDFLIHACNLFLYAKNGGFGKLKISKDGKKSLINVFANASEELFSRQMQAWISNNCLLQKLEEFIDKIKKENENKQDLLKDEIICVLKKQNDNTKTAIANQLIEKYGNDVNNEFIKEISKVVKKEIREVKRKGKKEKKEGTKNRLGDGNIIRQAHSAMMSYIPTLRKFYLDYILVALLAGLVGYMLKSSGSQQSVPEQQLIKNDMIADTLFIDADLDQGKISRPLLLSIAQRVIERTDSNWQKRLPVLCLHGDTIYKIPLVETGKENLQMLDSVLFGESLTIRLSPSNKDSLTVIGSDSIYVLSGQHRLLSQMRGKSLSADKLTIGVDTTFVFDNLKFEDNFKLKPGFQHLLYYFYIIDYMESCRKNSKIESDFCY